MFYCFAAILCPALFLTNGVVEYVVGNNVGSGEGIKGSGFGSGDMFNFGTDATLACNDGFVLVGGDALRTCGDEGEWSGQESTCIGM